MREASNDPGVFRGWWRGDYPVIVVAMNGWGPFLSPPDAETRTVALVREAVAGFGAHVLSGRTWWASSKVRETKAFIEEHNRRWETLLLVGKGLGAVTVVRAINSVAELDYRRVALLTIDPRPITWWLRTRPIQPHVLLTAELGRVTNFFAPAGYEQESGAVLRGKRVVNIPLAGEDHETIVERDEVFAELRMMARWVHSGIK